MPLHPPSPSPFADVSQGELTYTPYGKDGECNFSISREELNKFLMTEAEKAGVRMHFGYRVKSADFAKETITFETEKGDVTVNVC